MMAKQNITGIILAGGRSSRMGFEKGLIKLNGSTFLEHIIKALQPLVNDILIVSNNSDYDYLNQRRVEDIIKDSGPLAGIYSGLFHSKTALNLVLSCDVPLIKTDVLRLLIDPSFKDYDVVQLQSQNKSMPLLALYQKHCMARFKSLLMQDEKRLRFAVEQCHTHTILIDEKYDQFVRNVNTSEELNTLKHECEH